MSRSVADVHEVDLRLGPCHYGDFGEDATVVAVAHDDSGWIAVCDRPRQRAIDDGYEIRDE